MKKIIVDCDGVLLDWCYAFDVWMREHGYRLKPQFSGCFEQYKRYGVSLQESFSLVNTFNQTGALGYLPAFKDSVEYVTRLAREGWRFEVITMIGKDKFAHRLRKKNLLHLFGDVFDYIYCAGSHTEPKKLILEERYKNTNYIWVEDRVDYAQQGQEVGLNTFMMDHPYNKEWTGQRVKNWKELYDATQQCK